MFAYCGSNPINFEDLTGQFKRLANGKIQITKGDTLWNIAKALTGNGANWKKLGYKGNPKNLKIGVVFKVSESLPATGEPNSTQTLNNPDGTPKQDRKFGPDGKPTEDTDHNHGGTGHKFPHKHKWNNGIRGPAIAPISPIPNIFPIPPIILPALPIFVI